MNRYRVNSSLKRTAKYLKLLRAFEERATSGIYLYTPTQGEFFTKYKFRERIEFCKKHMRKLLERHNSSN